MPQLSYGAHVIATTSQAAKRIARWRLRRNVNFFVLPFNRLEVLKQSYLNAVKSIHPQFRQV